MVILIALSVNDHSRGDLGCLPLAWLGDLAVCLSSSDHKPKNILVALNKPRVDIDSWLGKRTLSKQSGMVGRVLGKGQEVVNVSDLCEVRTDRIDEQ